MSTREVQHTHGVRTTPSVHMGAPLMYGCIDMHAGGRPGKIVKCLLGRPGHVQL